MVSTTRWLVHPLSVPAALLCAHLTVVDPFEQIRGPAFVTTTRRGIIVSALSKVRPVSIPAAHRFTHLTVVDPFEQFRGPAFVRIMQGTSCIRRGNGNHCDSQKQHHGDYGLCSHHRCLFGLVSSSSWTCCAVVVCCCCCSSSSVKCFCWLCCINRFSLMFANASRIVMLAWRRMLLYISFHRRPRPPLGQRPMSPQPFHYWFPFPFETRTFMSR